MISILKHNFIDFPLFHTTHPDKIRYQFVRNLLMKTLRVTLPLCLFLISCASLQNSTDKQEQIPVIGTLVKKDKSLWNSQLEILGKPNMQRAVALSLEKNAFTRSKYNTYLDHRDSDRRDTGLQFIDSLPKPQYLSLQIADKIALQSLLNGEENSDVRAYLQKDEHYSIVSGVCIALERELSKELLAAEALYLLEAKSGQLAIAIMRDGMTATRLLPEGEIFEYSLSSFCWGLDRYGQPIVEAIRNTADGCPRGTEAKAYKLNETKSYLKL